jgi:hypothetical protein
MKIRGSIIWLVAIVAVLIALVLWHGKKQPVETNAAPSVTTAPSQSVSVPVRTNESPTQVASSSTPAAIRTPQSSLPQDKVGLLKEILQANDADIVFYGRLEDQFGNAVGNTPVNFAVRYENLNGRGVQRGQVVADENGLFKISGYRGQDLSVVPEKAGYVPLEMKGSGNYSPVLYSEDQRAHPDPNNPVVIKMWKQQGGEPLIHFSFNLRVPRDSTPVNFDFHTGTIVNAGGDLVIRLQCPLTPDTREQYDWQAIVQPVDGGIISNNERLELMFQAPDSGYESEFDIKNEKDVSPWSSTFHGGFYFKSHGGTCCGKFNLGIVIYAIRDGLVPITIDGYINPSGSRNLEIDPKFITEAMK